MLEQYLPKEAVFIIADWIGETNCDFQVTKPRKTKLGDYRRPYKGKGHRITVNADLNPFAFLLTTVHEFAHLRVWEIYGKHCKPHGQEWKRLFRELMDPFLKRGIFPEDLEALIVKYLVNPAASSGVDVHLQQCLRRYDQSDPIATLQQLEPNTIFRVANNRVFRKGEKLRKRYKCVEVKTGKIYLIHPMCEVFSA